MKAVMVTEYGGSDVLQYQEVDTPSITDNQVLIRVEATSVNFADIKGRIGNYHGAKKPPYIPGADVTGIIEAIGSKVTNLKVGQKVIAFPNSGAYAEYVSADAIQTFPIAESVPTDTAAAFPLVSFTSYNLLAKVAQLQEGETVLIHAASGGIGTTVIQLAKLLGAKSVIGTVGSDAKKAIALEAGADHVINYQEEDFAQKVLSLTDDKGVDVILDSLAGDVFVESLKCLAMFGRIVNFGNSKGGAGGTFDTKDLHGSCRYVLGYSFGTTKKHRPETLKSTAEGVIPFLESGQLKMFVGKTFKLQDAAQAHDWIEERKSTGKILLHP